MDDKWNQDLPNHAIREITPHVLSEFDVKIIVKYSRD